MIPLPATLKKYGLSAQEWQAMHDAQQGLCAICGLAPGTGRLCVDHRHIKGWKKMPPERRKLYVRALLCWTCNLMLVGRGVTLSKLRAAVAYLERHGQAV